MALDADKLKIAKDYNVADIVEQKKGVGKKRGSEVVYNCPFHNDKTESFSVNRKKNIAKCFGCGWSDDAIGFLVSHGSTFAEALEELSGGTQMFPSGQVQTVYKEQKVIEWKQIKPISEPKSFGHYRFGEPSMKPFAYRNSDGSIKGYVIRYDLTEGKVTLPYVYATDGKREEWRFQGFDTPRSLYNLDKIVSFPEKTILVVEGEKTADAGTNFLDSFDKVIVTTWAGGAEAMKHTDWTPLHGRRVIFWPDNDTEGIYPKHHKDAGKLKSFHDQIGNKAMLWIANELKPHCSVLKWINAPEGSPHKWDLADWKDGQNVTVRNYMIANVKDVPFYVESTSALPTAAQDPEVAIPITAVAAPTPKKEKSKYDTKHFRFIGYSAESGDHSYFFYRESTCKIISMTPGSMTLPNLIQMAPLRWWEEKFPASKGGVSIQAVIEYLIRTSEEKGSFDTDNIRGRGAWIENKDIVVHCGSHLIVNGIKQPLGAVGGKFMYENGKAFEIGGESIATSKEANQVRELLSMLNWERQVNADLLAGWCVVAPVCGALPWRPHIWLTGASGAGKSWIVEKIVEVLLGGSCKKVQGSGTSEAGIRQSIGRDARPIVFEEAEGDGINAQAKIQEILGLMRLASSENGGNVVKGSSSGRATNYVIRSCFAFASIAVQLVQRSDKTRVTILGLIENKREDKNDTWRVILEKYNSIMTEELVAKIQARTIHLLPVILKNIKTFSNAATVVLGSQRAGDQIGVLLAGAYSLTSESEVDFDFALNWIKQKDWSEEKGMDSGKDEVMLLGHIMKQITSVDIPDRGKIDRTIAELLFAAEGSLNDAIILSDVANNRLKRLGIKFHLDNSNPEYPVKLIMISNKNVWIDKCLAGTPWANGYSKILQRIQGARISEATRFAGTKDRAIILPFSVIE